MTGFLFLDRAHANVEEIRERPEPETVLAIAGK